MEVAASEEVLNPSDAGDALLEVERLATNLDDAKDITELRSWLEMAGLQFGVEVERQPTTTGLAFCCRR